MKIKILVMIYLIGNVILIYALRKNFDNYTTIFSTVNCCLLLGILFIQRRQKNVNNSRSFKDLC